MSLKITTLKLIEEARHRRSWYPRQKGGTTPSRRLAAQVIKLGVRVE